MKTALFPALGMIAAESALLWVRSTKKFVRPTAFECAVGFGTRFLDTLGIGSFATMSACFKLWSMVPDEEIPGAMNVGLALAPPSAQSPDSAWFPGRGTIPDEGHEPPRRLPDHAGFDGVPGVPTAAAPNSGV